MQNTIQFKANTHDAVYDALLATNSYYNDDVDIVAAHSKTQSAVAQFTVQAGYITGYTVVDAQHADALRKVFAHLIA